MPSLCIYDNEEEYFEVLTINGDRLEVPLFFLCSLLFTTLGLSTCKWMNDLLTAIDNSPFPNIKTKYLGTDQPGQGVISTIVITLNDDKRVKLPIDFLGIDKPYILPLTLISEEKDTVDPVPYIAPEWCSFFLGSI